ncbi:MAG: hypothetical protein HC810_02275 [Acaryochloridaceae cyanobacterium RL_2_7]|nr:hypothetical protein [Acaryochloridaceae cyanobacterium RL_2_7]
MIKAQTYPIVLIPETIRTAQAQIPPELPEFNLSPPSDPGPTPQRIKKREVTTQTAIAVIPGSLVAAQPKSRFMGLSLMAVAIIAMAAWIWHNVARNRQRKAAHQKYHNDMAIFRAEARCYDVKKQDAIAAFRLRLVLEILAQSLPPDGEDSRARRGWSEATFQDYLEEFFPNKIRTGETVYRPQTQRFPYTPDFIYFDPDTGLHINIEIDEPYAYLNRKPTHFIGYDKDETRNQRMLERKWLIVRFSEEQVVKWPESCCKTVAATIASVVGNDIPVTLRRLRISPSIRAGRRKRP